MNMKSYSNTDVLRYMERNVSGITMRNGKILSGSRKKQTVTHLLNKVQFRNLLVGKIYTMSHMVFHSEF